MERQIFIEKMLNKIRLLPDSEIKEVNDFADFLLSKIDDKILLEGIQKIESDSKSYDFLKDDEDLYSVKAI